VYEERTNARSRSTSCFRKRTLMPEVNSDFVLVHHVTLGATTIVVLIRKEYKEFISNIAGREIPLGLMDTAGNNGAVSVSFNLVDRRLLFINCRLEKSVKNRQRRVEQWQTVYDRIVMQTDPLAEQ